MRPWSMLVAMVALVLVTVVPEANSAAGTPITTCSQTVTTDAYLTQNLYCPGLNGVNVGADDITIDLKGFTIRGLRFLSLYGIYDDGFDGVTIKNGIVRNFVFGVRALNDADSVSVVNLTVSGNTNFGIAIDGASPSVKSSTASGNSGYGISIRGDGAKIQSSSATGNHIDGISVEGASTKVQSSTASGNEVYGIVVVGDNATIQKSTASGNSEPGIYVSGNSAMVKGNRTEANGFDRSFPGESDLDGFGIHVTGYTTPPTGTNIARGNDAPAECVPAQLC
jgi:Right handed beta helix region